MKKILATLRMMLLGTAIMASAEGSLAAEGISVEILGVNNTLVRVDSDGPRYLILPVQESNDEAKINVLVDGKLTQTLNVRLAKSKVDYTVPFNVSRFKGHDVVLNIVTTQNRSSVREAKQDACWNNLCMADTFDVANREKFRPLFHHTPRWGWMNDPNGMFYKDGVWHLAYQWNPYGSKWQNLSWGQAVSRDLINWDNDMEAVIAPDGLGMIFSGSSAIDRTGSAGFGKDAVVALYTSADVSQIQSLASSNDNAKTYDVYPGNPVLTLGSEARDPNMFWDEKNGRWVLALAHALDHEMLFFTSKDLKQWTLRSSFGKGLGAQGGVWECPDLFRLPVEGTGESKWVLLCNINPGGIFGGSATQYFIGDFDGCTFTADTDADGNVPTKWMDYGKDHYATVSFSDAPEGRRTVIGWMSNWQYAAEVPTMQFRSANTLPRDLALFHHSDGQVYLKSAPSPEVSGLRSDKVRFVKRARLGSKPVSYALPADNNGICEIVATLEANKSVVMTLSNPQGEHVDIVYDANSHTLSFDRRNAGLSDFSQDFPAVTSTDTYENGGRVTLRIFVDTSSIELFGDNGRFVMTNLVFPTSPYSTLSFKADGGKAQMSDLYIFGVRPTMN